PAAGRAAAVASATPEATPRRRGSHSAWTLAAAVLGFFVITLDAVVVNVALPAIRREFGGGIAGLQWGVDGYTLMFAALLLAAWMRAVRIDRSPDRRVQFDWVGHVTAVVAMGALTYGAIEAGVAGFGASRVVTAFVVAVEALAAFVTAEARGRHPIVPTDLFR